MMRKAAFEREGYFEKRPVGRPPWKLSAHAKAKRDGKKFFSTGAPCKNGHEAMRRTDNGRCVKCQSEQSRKPHDIARRQEDARLRKYGIDEEQFDAMMERQNGMCAICSKQFGTGRGDCPCIDHDHESGEVRELLCGACNAGLGHFRDDPKLLKRAIAYLERHNAKKNLQAKFVNVSGARSRATS